MTFKQIQEALENIEGSVSTDPTFLRDQLSELAKLVRLLADKVKASKVNDD